MKIAAAKKGEPFCQSLRDLQRSRRFVKHAAPGHVAGIPGMHLREEMMAYDRPEAVGANDDVCFDLLAAGKHGDRARACRGEAQTLIAVVIGLLRERCLKLVEYRVPRGE